MCCKHNVLISFFCELLLSDVDVLGSPLIKEPLSNGNRQGRKARHLAPSTPLENPKPQPLGRVRRPLCPQDRAEASGNLEAAGP